MICAYLCVVSIVCVWLQSTSSALIIRTYCCCIDCVFACLHVYRQLHLYFCLARIVPNTPSLASGVHASVGSAAADEWNAGKGHIYPYTVWASVPESVSEPQTKFCFHYIRGLDLMSSEAMTILVACSRDQVYRCLWACALHNLGQTRMAASEEMATCSDKVGHGLPRQKSCTRTWISINIISLVLITSELELGCLDRDFWCSVNAP